MEDLVQRAHKRSYSDGIVLVRDKQVKRQSQQVVNTYFFSTSPLEGEVYSVTQQSYSFAECVFLTFLSVLL